MCIAKVPDQQTTYLVGNNKKVIETDDLKWKSE